MLRRLARNGVIVGCLFGSTRITRDRMLHPLHSVVDGLHTPEAAASQHCHFIVRARPAVASSTVGAGMMRARVSGPWLAWQDVPAERLTTATSAAWIRVQRPARGRRVRKMPSEEKLMVRLRRCSS